MFCVEADRWSLYRWLVLSRFWISLKIWKSSKEISTITSGFHANFSCKGFMHKFWCKRDAHFLWNGWCIIFWCKNWCLIFCANTDHAMSVRGDKCCIIVFGSYSHRETRWNIVSTSDSTAENLLRLLVTLFLRDRNLKSLLLHFVILFMSYISRDRQRLIVNAGNIHSISQLLKNRHRSSELKLFSVYWLFGQVLRVTEHNLGEFHLIT